MRGKFVLFRSLGQLRNKSSLNGNQFEYKGPGLIRGIFGLRFSEKYVITCQFCLAICHNYKINPQIFVLMYSVAMETSTIIVKMLFFSIFHTLLPFSEL